MREMLEVVPLPNSEVTREVEPVRTRSIPTGGGGAVLSSRALAEAIVPWIEEVRVSLVGAADVTLPFDTGATAVAWLERVASEQKVPSARQRRKAHALRIQARDALEQAARIWRSRPSEVSYTLARLPYLKTNERSGRTETKEVHVRTDCLLWILADAAEQISRATGFDGAGIVMHVLTGRTLSLPQTRLFLNEVITIHGEIAIQRTWAVFELSTPEGFTEPRVREAVRRLRRRIGLTKKKGFVKEDAKLSVIIQNVGPRRPTERPVDYWRRVQTACGEKGRRFSSPWKAKQAVSRLQWRLRRVVPVPEMLSR
jgi:hypothetical protein